MGKTRHKLSQAPDFERYAIVRPGSIEWDAALALASHGARRQMQALGVWQFERQGEAWARITRITQYINKSRTAT